MQSNTVFAIVLCLIALPFSGCGQGEQYQAMSGSVTVDGAPLKKGIITFYPIGPGTTAGGQITEGSFDLDISRGASPGKYRVEITASRPTGKKEFDIDLKAEVDIEEQYLPPKYNLKSELTCEVVGSGDNKYEFALTTTKK